MKRLMNMQMSARKRTHILICWFGWKNKLLNIEAGVSHLQIHLERGGDENVLFTISLQDIMPRAPCLRPNLFFHLWDKKLLCPDCVWKMVWLLLCPSTESTLCVQSSPRSEAARQDVWAGEKGGGGLNKSTAYVQLVGQFQAWLGLHWERFLRRVWMSFSHPRWGGGSECRQTRAGFNHTSAAQAASLCTARKAIYRCCDTEPHPRQLWQTYLNPWAAFVLWAFSLYVSDAWEHFSAVDGGRITEFPHSKLLRN